MPILQTPELAIHYETAGRGRSAIVLVHGNFATWRWWKAILDNPPRGFRVFAPTMRGFGSTHTTARARSVDVLARDLHAFIRGLDLDNVYLVGHSLGGAVALEYALTWPATLLSLGLVAPASGDAMEAMRSRTDSVGMLLRWTDPSFLASRVVLLQTLRWQRFVGTRRDAVAQALAGMMPSVAPGTGGELDALLADALAIDELVVVDTYEALRRWDIRPHLSRLDIPVRILAGGLDTLVPLHSLEALTRALPRATLDVWQHVGHSPQLERPREFASWLSGLRPGRFVQLRERMRGLVTRIRRLLRRAQRSLPRGSGA